MEAAESFLTQMATASANLTPRGPPLNFYIQSKIPAVKHANVQRPPPPPPAAVPSFTSSVPPLQTVVIAPPLPPLLDSPVNIDLTKKGPCRLKCQLNGMPVYVYIDTQGVEYIGIEKFKGLRGAFNDDHRRQFELEINDITNAAGQLVKVKRSAVDGLEVYKTHNNLLRVNDLEVVMQTKFSGLLPREITAILDDFIYSMHAAEERGEKAASPEPDEEVKPTKRVYRKKRDREEADGQMNETNAILLETVLRLETKVDQLTDSHKATVRDNDSLKETLGKVSKYFDTRMRDLLFMEYKNSNVWKNRKLELEAQVTFDTQALVRLEFNNDQVPKLKAEIKADVAKAELERIKKLLQQ